MSLFSDLGGMVENAIAQQGGVNAIFTQALSGMGGYDGILAKLNQAGLGNVVNSWVGTGPNKQISPGDLASALGADQINTLTSQTGLSRDELLSGLAKQLPDIINQLTPDGRLPTEREASRWI